MASRTQLRLGQITGSFGTNAIIDSQAVSSAANLAAYNATSGSMVGVMSDIASALLRIHGGNTFAGGDVGTLKDIDGNTRITYAADGKLLLSGSGTGSDAVDIDAPRGGFSVDGVQASNITVTSAGAADDLTISQVGGNDSSILITAAGTGADAVSIDVSAGSMVIAPSLIDGKTLKLGNNASTEMVFTPSSTAGNEKISLINKAGTADNAILIDSEAGGVTIAAGNDSLVLDADGTDADAIIINSAGGIDVDAVDKINIATTKAAADALVIDVSGNGGADITIGNAANDANANLDLIVMNKFNITVSGSDSGDGVQVKLGTDNTDSAFKILNNSGQDAFVVNGGKNATLEGTLTVNGNLDINGTTTTIDTTNLTVEDSIIALGVSGSGAYSATGDRGILFPRGAAGSFTAGLYFDGTDFKFASTQTGPTSGSFTAPANAAAYSTLRAGKINSENETDATSTTDGALQTDGGLSVKLDAVIGNDLHLLSNGAILNFGAAQKFTATHANANNTLTVTSNHRLAFGNAAEFLAGDGTDLSINSSGLVNFDIGGSQDIVFKEGGTEFGRLDKDGNDLRLTGSIGGINLDAKSGKVKFEQLAATFLEIQNSTATSQSILSSSVGQDLVLDANSGVVHVVKEGTSSPNRLAFDVASVATEIKLGHYDAANTVFDVGYLTLDTNAVSILSASAGLRIDAGSTAAQLQLVQANGSNFIALDVPASLSDDVVFTLPAEDGSANQAMITDGSGNLSFTSLGASSARKGIFIMTASIAAGTAVGTDHGQDLASDAITFSGVTAIQGRVVDVFVNGQLLTSGSATERASVTAGADYEIASTKTLKFAFALEEDDIIQVVKRG